MQQEKNGSYTGNQYYWRLFYIRNNGRQKAVEECTHIIERKKKVFLISGYGGYVCYVDWGDGFMYVSKSSNCIL